MTKSTITRERLEKIKSWRETYGAGSNVMLPAEEAEALARIALAAMDSEPVAWVVHARTGDQLTTDGSYVANAEGILGLHSTPLYRHAQQPVVPGERDKTIDADDHPLLWSFNEGWNACRAAMLNGGKS